MASAPAVQMSDGYRIPQIGLGIRLIEPRDLTGVLPLAVGLGYRLIDTAQTYGNEAGVGRALACGAVSRDQLFVTTKIANRNQGRAQARSSFEVSMQALGLDVLDLLLVHWPMPMFDRYIETWRVLEELRAGGLVRSIGVSNFMVPHLRRLLDETGIPPVLNQVELHPYHQQQELREFHARHGILTEAWAPLGQGGDLLADPVIGKIAAAKKRSPAQIVLRWHVQIGNVVVPKSSAPQRMADNLSVYDFTLERVGLGRDLAVAQERMGPDPEAMSAM